MTLKNSWFYCIQKNMRGRYIIKIMAVKNQSQNWIKFNKYGKVYYLTENWKNEPVL